MATIYWCAHCKRATYMQHGKCQHGRCGSGTLYKWSEVYPGMSAPAIGARYNLDISKAKPVNPTVTTPRPSKAKTPPPKTRAKTPLKPVFYTEANEETPDKKKAD